MRQYYKGLVGPWRLASHPALKNMEVITSIDRFFRHNDHLNNAIEIFD